MSRPGPSRNLTLTEELEKLEQSITLTLQEIDHNFSKAHRIVTTSILPLVEQYGEHSKNVWEASKFWKQFFEASANVSLSGYEELANDEDTTAATGQEETTQIADTTEATEDYTPADHDEQTQQHDYTADQSGAYQDDTQTQQDHHHHDVEDSLLDDDSLAGSTPRVPATKSMRNMQFAQLNTPYENLRRELKGSRSRSPEKGGQHAYGEPMDEDVGGSGHNNDDDDDETMQIPEMTTQIRMPDMSMGSPVTSSLLDIGTPAAKAKLGKGPAFGARDLSKAGKDPLLHRVLDKNYRIQATPHKSFSPAKAGGGGRGTAAAAAAAALDDKDASRRALWQDSPQSSPEMAAPTLRTNLYSNVSPVKAPRLGAGAGRGLVGRRDSGPRTPGISVQTPGTARKTRDVFAEEQAGKGKGAQRYADEINWDSDDDEEMGGVLGGMSPPKTIQFALPPSKLMQTPAREASKRIVEDILLTAGAAPEYGEDSEQSPSMVKMNHDILDDSF